MRTSLKFATLILLSMTGLYSGNASARDDHLMFPLSDALENSETKGVLDKDVRLYFGAQKHPAIVTKHGQFRTNKKTNAFNKGDKTACEWAFASAIKSLQERAVQEGGNAVVNIRSNYKNQVVSSESDYMCGAGAFAAGVAFIGDVVTLKK